MRLALGDAFRELRARRYHKRLRGECVLPSRQNPKHCSRPLDYLGI